jgi:hypothetical protein
VIFKSLSPCRRRHRPAQHCKFSFHTLILFLPFLQAQENILALNGSRMRALQELRAANEKIAELEKKLEDATTQISRLATRHTSITAEPEQHASAKTSSTSISTSSTPASTSLITVSYVTGWDTVYLHFQIDDQRK